ncbi:MAG: ribosome maturation factor RimP [Chlorobiaceae bacterium]|nr:ribosome maturation factor RimP [Chlorobiaceae bacterium]NTV61264.1 ribosome maturation factor RimP [Chlorobiaceae bacterium]
MQERIGHYVLQVIEELQGIYLVEFRLKGPKRGPKIEIILDTDSGIRIAECARFSRRLRELLESDADLLAETGDDFELMVSSPGLGEPLKLARQYIRHTGKPLRITYADEAGTEKEIFGHLAEVRFQDDERPSITLFPIQKKAGGRKTEKQPLTLYLDRIVRAVPEAVL